MTDPDRKNQPIASQEELDKHDEEFAEEHREIAEYGGSNR